MKNTGVNFFRRLESFHKGYGEIGDIADYSFYDDFFEKETEWGSKERYAKLLKSPVCSIPLPKSKL